jgi:hypothetical protein
MNRSSSPSPSIYEFILSMCACADNNMVDERYERYATADFTASFDDDLLSMCEEANREYEIFKSRPFPHPTTFRLGFEESESAPAIRPVPSLGTATTVSMDDLSLTSTSSTELITHLPRNNHNSGNIGSLCKSITFIKVNSIEGDDDDRESGIGCLNLASPVSESESTQEQYHQAPLSKESRYPTKGEKDELVRHFKLQQKRCFAPTPFLVLQ